MRKGMDLIGLTKPLVFLAALYPAAQLTWALIDAFWFGAPLDLGPNPAQTIQFVTGDWSLQFLLLSLAVTPLRRLSGWSKLIRYRRMLGLFAFFYGVLHLLAYVAFDQVFRLDAILADIVKRPFIFIGTASLVLMTPLAITSTKGWIRRLGPRWNQLHKLAYATAIFGVLHYWWLVKRDITWPAIYGAVLLALLAARLLKSRSAGERRARRAAPAGSSPALEKTSTIPSGLIPTGGPRLPETSRATRRH